MSIVDCRMSIRILRLYSKMIKKTGRLFIFLIFCSVFLWLLCTNNPKNVLKDEEDQPITLKSLTETHPLYTINNTIFSRNTTCINFKHFEYMDDSGYPIIPEFAWIDKVILPEYSNKEEVYWIRMPGWKYEGYAEIVKGDSEVPIYQDKIHFGNDGDKYIYHGAPCIGR